MKKQAFWAIPRRPFLFWPGAGERSRARSRWTCVFIGRTSSSWAGSLTT